MSPAERFRRNPVLARVLVERLRAGTTLTATAPGADAREVEEAAADMLDAGLAEPATGAHERALAAALSRMRAQASALWGVIRSFDAELAAAHAERARLLAALDAAETRAAQAERERDEATHGAEALAARLTEIRSLYEDARAEWRLGGDDGDG